MQKNDTASNIGLFILRLGVASIFIPAGLMKLMNFSSMVDMFGNSFGFPIPTAFLVVTLAIELIGGLAVLIGVYTRFTASLLAIVMVVALLTVKGAQGFQAARLDIVLLASSLALAFTGPGGLRLAFARNQGHQNQRQPETHPDSTSPAGGAASDSGDAGSGGSGDGGD